MKNTKSKISFIIMILLATVIAFFTYSFLNTAKTQTFVFNDGYTIGTKITKDMLVSRETDSETVRQVRNTSVDNAYYITNKDLDTILGKTLRADVLRGMPLMANMTDELGGSPVEKRLDSNAVGVSVAVDSVAASNPFLQYGSRVNVYSTYETDDEIRTEVILQNIKVVDVLYDDIDTERTGAPSVMGVTLEVSIEDSLELINALEIGSVRLGNVALGDYEEKEVPVFIKANALDSNKEIKDETQSE